jgi:twitching motility protein PilT
MTAIENLMDACLEQGASDLHLSVGRPPVIRKRGHLVELEGFPTLSADDMSSLIRSFTPQRNLAELEEVGTSDFGHAHGDKCRFRISVMRQRGCEGAVMRVIPNKLLSFEQIGLPEAVRELLKLHRGLILVTGPTGSGKTTTLATMIDWINQNRDVHIITIEDPIEFYHKSAKSQITQREVGADVTTFAEAMRRALRQDPDVILLGEMRDLETTSAAISAAETGHLVMGTLHTTGAARTINRIIDQYPTDQQEQIRSQLAVALVAVVSQILIPTADGVGRVAGFEVMITTPAIENHIRKNETHKIPSVLQTSRRQGMLLMDDHLLDLYRNGRITKEDAIERAFDGKALAQRMGGAV